MGTVEAALRCDFCGNPDVAWLIPCEDFEQEISNATIGEMGGLIDRTTITRSEGAWSACQDCFNVLEKGGVTELVDRVGDLYRQADPTLADPALYGKVKDALTVLYERFENHRVGKPTQRRKAEDV